MFVLIARTLILGFALAVSGNALAAQPYEGSWCEDGSQVFVIEGKTFTDIDLAADGEGECRIKSVKKQDNVTWHFNVLCGGEPAKYSVRLVPGKRAVINEFANDSTPRDVKRCER